MNEKKNSLKKLNLYFFGEIGEYDEFNPALICKEDMVSECLYFIAKNEPYSIGVEGLCEGLEVDDLRINEIIKSLKRIRAIEEKDGGFRLAFTAILERDISVIDKYSRALGKIIGDKVMEMKEFIYERAAKFKCADNFCMERILYHIICDKIFDGSAFDFFSGRNVFKDSKEQPGGRDYIIVAYEDSESLNDFSDNLLCSSNNYRADGYVFNSFGDSMGDRKDMYRFLRRVQSSIHKASPWEKLNMEYNKIIDMKNVEMASRCGNLLSRSLNEKVKVCEFEKEDKLYFDFMREIEYLRENEEGIVELGVPQFYTEELESLFCEISDGILENILGSVKESFENFERESGGITPVNHGVDIKETANELWHQVFGAANEYLVDMGFVQAPVHIKGEGRYLRSITIR